MSKIKITNRSNTTAGYTLPEINLSRWLAPGESREIDADELQKLAYQPGGQQLIDEYFLIHDTEEAQMISPLTSKEPEYFLDAEGVKRLLQSGSLDEFLDCLDFAPEGVLDLIKDLSISLPCTDMRKLEAYQNKTGINLIKIIEANKPEPGEEQPTPLKRRVAIHSEEQVEEEAPTRRVQPKYNVINRK